MTDDAAAPGISLREGDLLAGKYRIAKILGAGGMGAVVAAQHIHLDEKVAIKVLLPEVANNREVVTRFAREARAAAKIKSEHVARVIDVGSLESGAPFMVLEYLEGGDLESLLGQSGSLQVEEAVDFVLQACEAIAEAHSLGIIHRDLKPANLFCARRADGTLAIKVLDFGISKLTGTSVVDRDVTMTKTAAVMGSPLYMSPEQLESSRDVDVRTDIWSLGVILYELLAGSVPFSGVSFSELCVKIVTTPLPPLRSSRCDIPPALERVVARCLEKDRNNRYANVAELALGLAPFASSRGRHSVEPILGVLRRAGSRGAALAVDPFRVASANQGHKTDTVNPWGRTEPEAARKGGRAFWGVGAVLVIPLVAVAMRWPTNEGGGEAASRVTATTRSLGTDPPSPILPGRDERTRDPEPQKAASEPPGDVRIAATPTRPKASPSGAGSRSRVTKVLDKTASGPNLSDAPTPYSVDVSAKPAAANVPAVGSTVQAIKRSVYEDRK